MHFYRSLLILFTFFVFCMNVYSIDLKVQIKNGTNGGIGSVDKIKVILLRDGMVPIREMGAQTGNFTIQGLDVPDGSPVLIQATYKGANYNKMVPPVPAMRSKIQEIEVYESSTDIKILKTRSLLQIVREKDSIQVFKIYLIQNNSNPPRSYQSSGLEVFIPQEATGIMGSWTQGQSQMAIPLEFKDQGNGIRLLERSVLPGSTDIQISYRIPAESGQDVTFEDGILFEEPSNEKPIFAKPLDMKLEFSSDSNPQILKDDIPEGLNAFMVKYENGTKKTKISLIGGTPVIPKLTNGPRQVVNGNLIPEWDTSLVAIIGFLALLFSLSYIGEYIKRKNQKHG
ncbi:hypothetical protein [Leptospira sp. GIMC2001]|uniref:hypothetical protein n=1 Tax=Leptospira sp. GIMC2001 TaxID=1513297 RepID=UPI002349EF4F|nr:hypothetical protein [Leptospira sp. GIMC2001]WCL48534.1 hypothetical protein O4O04_14665 [Leptospira sp. GIMC2001]